MLGLDANVLIRLATNDEPRQAAKAAAAIRKASRCFVNRVTIIEVVWVLQSAYALERTNVADAIDGLLQIENLTVEDRDVVRRATQLYRDGSDFADALVAESNARHGCSTTYTFDRSASRQLDRMTLVP